MNDPKAIEAVSADAFEAIRALPVSRTEAIAGLLDLAARLHEETGRPPGDFVQQARAAVAQAIARAEAARTAAIKATIARAEAALAEELN